MPDSFTNPPYRYWAFISYNHKDKSWGQWLHRAIETYGIPADLVDSHTIPTGHSAPKRFHPSYLDREETRVAPDLHLEIEEALRDSHFLIVVCSPNAVKSPWVNTEIETFQKLGGDNRVFAIIVGGEPNVGDDDECFPPALRNRKLIAADARPEGDGKNNAKLKILAGMLGVKFDALKQRDKRRRARRTLSLALAASVAFAAIGVTLSKLHHVERMQSIIAKKIQFLPDEADALRSKIESAKLSEGAGDHARAALDGILDGIKLPEIPGKPRRLDANSDRKPRPSCWFYVTQKSETVATVARKFALAVEELQLANSRMQKRPDEFFADGQTLHEGVVLGIPKGVERGTFVWLNDSSYVGERVTTLSQLAERLNTTPALILALNPEFVVHSNIYFATKDTFRPGAVWTLRIPQSSEPRLNRSSTRNGKLRHSSTNAAAATNSSLYVR